MLFVQNDETQLRRGRKDRAASTHNDLDFPAGDPPPVLVPLDVAEVAVKDGDTIEPGAKAADSLRR